MFFGIHGLWIKLPEPELGHWIHVHRNIMLVFSNQNPFVGLGKMVSSELEEMAC